MIPRCYNYHETLIADLTGNFTLKKKKRRQFNNKLASLLHPQIDEIECLPQTIRLPRKYEKLYLEYSRILKLYSQVAKKEKCT